MFLWHVKLSCSAQLSRTWNGYPPRTDRQFLGVIQYGISLLPRSTHVTFTPSCSFLHRSRQRYSTFSLYSHPNSCLKLRFHPCYLLRIVIVKDLRFTKIAGTPLTYPSGYFYVRGSEEGRKRRFYMRVLLKIDRQMPTKCTVVERPKCQLRSTTFSPYK